MLFFDILCLENIICKGNLRTVEIEISRNMNPLCFYWQHAIGVDPKIVDIMIVRIRNSIMKYLLLE